MKSKTSCFNKTIFLKKYDSVLAGMGGLSGVSVFQYDRANVPEHPQLYEYPGS